MESVFGRATDRAPWSGPPPARERMRIAPNWAGRPLGSGVAQGDWLYLSDTGAVLRYSAVWGDWVPPEVAEGTVVVDAQITGNVLPSAENPAWTHNTANGGAISVGGGKVTLDTMGADNEQAYLTFDHGTVDQKHYAAGYVQVTNQGTSDRNGIISVRDGNQDFELSLAANALTQKMGLYGATGAAIDYNDAATLAAEAYVELMITANQVRARQNLSREWSNVARRAAFGALAQDLYVIGDGLTTGGAQIAMTIRGFKIGRF